MAQVMQQLGSLSLTQPTEKRMPKLNADRPAYGISGKGFFNDQDKFLCPGQATYFDGEPNLDLIPLNKKAYDRMQEFLDKLDNLAAQAAKKAGKSFVPAARQVWVEDGMSEMPTPSSVFGVRKTGSDDTIY